MAAEFTLALKYNNLSYAANVLSYLREQPDFDMNELGREMQPLLSRFRQINKDYISEYYEMLTGLCTWLIKFAALTESCSKSGAYAKKRDECVTQLKEILIALESQPDVMDMLRNMHVPPLPRPSKV